MAINIKRYVDITSGVGAGASVRQRDLTGMIFTTNPKVPIDAAVEMTSAADVAAYFGVPSLEAKRAAFYFDYISKTITRPKKLGFARYSPNVTMAAIFGGKAITLLSSWQAINAGSLNLTINGETADLTALNFASCVSLSDVANIIQTALNALSSAIFKAATIAYDAITSSFNLNAGASGTGKITIDASGSNSVASMLGWAGTSTVLSPGTNAEAPLDAFLRVAERNNNFGSFIFMDKLDLNDIVAIAQQNSGRNIEFMYCVPATTVEEAESYSAAMMDLSGVSVTYAPTGEFDEMAPMILLAATDYNRRNNTINYMFNEFNLTAKVDTNADASFFDRLRVNYMGVTQTAGQLIKFYQRGVMMGTSTAPVDMNTYANEMWFKDAAAAQLLELLLAMPKVSANRNGRGQVMAVLQNVIEKALFNGTISVGKEISTTQQLYVAEMTGDSRAWHQLSDIGYWLDCDMVTDKTTDGRTEWAAKYLLVYSKDDVIRKIEGTHTLI